MELRCIWCGTRDGQPWWPLVAGPLCCECGEALRSGVFGVKNHNHELMLFAVKDGALTISPGDDYYQTELSAEQAHALLEFLKVALHG